MTKRPTKILPCLVVLATTTSSLVSGFVTPAAAPMARRTNALSMNFFKDLVGKAFENDAGLDNDITKGQYDGPTDDYDDGMSVARLVNPQLTKTQQQWRAAQQNAAGSATPSKLLTGSQWRLDLFLTGIPDRDPSNDLFASKVNISSRDRKVGLMVPEEPTVGGVLVTLLEDGVCQVESDSEFVDAANPEGQWKVSEDGANIRMSMNVMGYQRTVQTKGSIQKVYWSQEEDKVTATQSAYTIPAGPMYGDATLTSGNQVGNLQWNDGILRVEQSAGLLGAGSKMVPCGRFTATRVDQ